MMQNEIFEKDSDFRFSSDELGFTFIKKTKALTNPRRHFHPWWEILYIISGERTFFYGNKTVQAKAGTFLIVAPGVLHRAINPEGETCSLYNIFNESHSDFVLRKNHFDEINSILSTLEPFIQLDEKEIETMNILFQRLTVELSEKKNNFELISRA
ncbi:cupin domain-containing protein, partial [Treponema sp.]|uniref:cupin domain-containing protein n=1 Tax=Treponema sp. TaxID=166 RepID=UPI00388DD7B6